MELLRRARHLTCLVLAWFALSVGVAIAAPAMQPAGDDVICSGSGATASGAADQHGGPHGHAHDCVLCGIAGAPTAPSSDSAQPLPVAQALPVLPLPVAGEPVVPFSSRAPPAA